MSVQQIILNQIAKRRRFPVPELGDDVFVRSLSRGELESLGKIEKDKKTDFMIGCVLVDEAGIPVCPRDAANPLSDEDFADTVALGTQDWDVYALKTLSAAVNKITNVPPAETVVKN
ncbi:MAG: hypothetical protein WCH39_01660 [Schlesneria sp.]